MSKFDPSLKICTASTERLLPSREFLGLIRAVLEKGAVFRLKAKGMSMNPFICDGDIVTIGKINKIKLGDIVAAAQPESEKLMIHRVIAIGGDRVLIKGDGNWAADGWVKREKIYGSVFRVERGSRTVRPGNLWQRWLISFISRQTLLQRIRFSIYKRLLYLGEVY